MRGWKLLAVATVFAAGTAAALGIVDPSSLPLGDGRYTTGARAGYVDSCQTTFNGAGAQVNGPWITGSNWNETKKSSVQGSVHWNGRFSDKVSGTSRVLSGNGLPLSPTGVFPIAASDP